MIPSLLFRPWLRRSLLAWLSVFLLIQLPAAAGLLPPLPDRHDVRGAWALQAVTLNKPAPEYRTTLIVSGLPPGISLVEKAVTTTEVNRWLAGTVAPEAVGTYTVVLTATASRTVGAEILATSQFQWTIDADSIPPAVSFASFPVAGPSSPLTAPPGIVPTGSPVLIGLRSSELLQGLTVDDFLVLNGTIVSTSVTQAFTPGPIGSGAVGAPPIAPLADYVIQVVPNGLGVLIVSLGAGRATDYSGNANPSVLGYYAPGGGPTLVPGLRADFFANDTLAGEPVLTRTDGQLSFYWPEATSPGPRVPGDHFSARWTGKIKAPSTGTFVFDVDADDGVRLWANGTLVLDHWNLDPGTYFGLTSTPLNLLGGENYDFRVEFQDFFSDAYLQVRWSANGVPLGLVAPEAFSQPERTDYNAAVAALPAVARSLTLEKSATDGLQLSFVRPTALNGMFVVQISPDLRSWQSVSADTGWTVTPLADGLERVTMPWPPATRFARIAVVDR